MLNGISNDAEIDIDLNLEYSELDKSITLSISSKGEKYDPFLAIEGEEVHLGVTILKNIAQCITHTYIDDVNNIAVKL